VSGTMLETAHGVVRASVNDTDVEPYVVEVPDPAAALRRRRRILTLVCQVGLVIAVIALWQLVSSFTSPITVSSPSSVYHALTHYVSNGLGTDLVATMEEVVLGYLAGALLGIAFGALLASIPLFANVLEPFILGFYGVPKIAFAPLLVVWLGIDLTPKVTLAAMMTFFVVFFSTYDGVRAVDRGRLNAVLMMGASRLQLRRYVVFPGARSNIFLGLKLGVPEALVGAIVGEFISASKGVGYSIQFATARLDTAGVFAGLIVLTVLSIALNTAVKATSGRMDTGSAGERSVL
jgi:NitT/TauT family transport system permease protein